MKFLKVKARNMTTPAGNPAANQFIIETPRYLIFQSYKTIIAVFDRKTDTMYLDKYYWNYSKTTGKYRNQFLGETIKETKKKIKNGTYKLVNLNS